MEKRKLLKEVKKCYENGGNVIQYLKEIDNRTENTIEDILISYDFQAGTYYEKYKERTKKQELVYDSIAEILSRYVNIVGEKCVVMEAGIGEATTMGPVLKRIGENKVGEIYGFDISWSRIMYAKKFLTELYDGKCPENIKLFTGDLMNMPVKESSVDILYTVHAAEPNGGKEKEVLKELYRVAGRYLILFELAYELADEKARERMKKHGYITNMYETAIELGYNVKSYELLDNCINPDNPTGVMIIEKKKDTDLKDNNDGSRKVFACPVSKEDVCICENVMYCEDSMLIYPIIQDIPCLLEDNAIIATKFKEVYV